MLLVFFSGRCTDDGLGIVVEIGHSGVQVEKRLRSFPPLESELLSLLTPCGTVGLLQDVVTARCGNHLLVIDALQARKLPDRAGNSAADRCE